MKFLTQIRLFLIGLLDAVPEADHLEVLTQTARDQFQLGEISGIAIGETRAQVKFAVLPLPFTEDQLAGRHYGEFITPAGFANEFGACNIPAPSAYGYEQRAYYVAKSALNGRLDLTCYNPKKFDSPWDHRDTLVPVIVTVLR